MTKLLKDAIFEALDKAHTATNCRDVSREYIAAGLREIHYLLHKLYDEIEKPLILSEHSSAQDFGYVRCKADLVCLEAKEYSNDQHQMMALEAFGLADAMIKEMNK